MNDNNQQAAREWLPCPFCGSRPELQKDGGHDERSGYNFRVIVRCKGCSASISVGSGYDKNHWCNENVESVTDRAVEAWNRRPTPPDSGERNT